MTTLNIPVDESELEAARTAAARQRTTLERLVADFLAALAGKSRPSPPEDLSEDQRSAIQDLLELGRRSTAIVGKITWKREDLYERGIPTRH